MTICHYKGEPPCNIAVANPDLIDNDFVKAVMRWMRDTDYPHHVFVSRAKAGYGVSVFDKADNTAYVLTLDAWDADEFTTQLAAIKVAVGSSE